MFLTSSNLTPKFVKLWTDLMGYTRSFDRWLGTSGPHGPTSALLAVLAHILPWEGPP